MAQIRVENLRKDFGAFNAVKSSTFTVEDGEFFMLLGPSGCGKTTTLRSIVGIMRKRQGEIRLAGRDMMQVPLHRTAHHGLGYVPEERGIFASLNVIENLMLPPSVGEGMKVEEIFELFPNLYERRNSPGTRLSGGEQQMLAVGRALMTNPRLLILDEATEGLAPVIRQDIWRAIRTLKADGLSILVVDKTLSELLPVADRCVVLENGRNVWQGTADALSPELQDRYLGV